MKTKKVASAAKKSAKIVAMSAAVAASMHLNAEDARAMRCAFEDMVEEFGHQALIVSMNPFGPMIA